MVGFRLTGGSNGCPPVQTPPADYVNPFRFDSAGRLWITSCFKGFEYFGYARYDTPGVIMGTALAPINNPWPGLPGAASISSGSGTNLTITNDTECTIGILVGLDLLGDMTTLCASYVSMHVAAQWNGAHLSSSNWSNPQITGMSGYLRQQGNVSANPHDIGVEGGGANVVTLAPGAVGVLTSRIYIAHSTAAAAFDVVNSASCAARAYGYVLS